jgi:cyclin D5, plant
VKCELGISFLMRQCVCFFDQAHVHTCYNMMVGDMNRRDNKRSLSCSGSNEAVTSTYDSVLVDDVTDTAAFATAVVATRNKRIRLELPGIL